MKLDDIQLLLQKYQAGTLSPDENAELNRLTHKDEVLATAFHKADGIVRRRRMRYASFALTGLVLLGVGIWIGHPTQMDTPMIAELQEVPAAVVDEVPAAIHTQPTVTREPVKAEERIQAATTRPVKAAKVAPQPVAPIKVSPAAEEQTIVVCNTQCEADSVITNIWKFLSA